MQQIHSLAFTLGELPLDQLDLSISGRKIPILWVGLYTQIASEIPSCLALTVFRKSRSLHG